MPSTTGVQSTSRVKGETWKQKRADMQASVSMRVRVCACVCVCASACARAQPNGDAARRGPRRGWERTPQPCARRRQSRSPRPRPRRRPHRDRHSTRYQFHISVQSNRECHRHTQNSLLPMWCTRTPTSEILITQIHEHARASHRLKSAGARQGRVAIGPSRTVSREEAMRIQWPVSGREWHVFSTHTRRGGY